MSDKVTGVQKKLIARWVKAKEKAEAVKSIIETERELRKEVIASLFKTPKEGSNYIQLDAHTKIKLNYKIDRKLDESSYLAVLQQFREYGIPCDSIVVQKPTLALKEYRLFCEDHPDAAEYFEGESLEVTPGSHSLEIVGNTENLESQGNE